jgi:hypothetical protein
MAESERLAALVWRKSRASGVNGGACVEVAFLGQSVLIRDSRNKSSPPLMISVQEWRTFLGRMKAGNL